MSPRGGLLTPPQMRECLEALRIRFDDVEVINQRQNRIVIRWRQTPVGEPIIIKMWARPDLKGRLRRFFGMAACNYEWRNLLRMSRFGVSVPRPLGFCRVLPSIAGYTDVLFMEDLGGCESASDHLKQLVQAGKTEQALRFENVLIDITEQIVKAGMLDMDHGMNNIVVTSSGRTVKLDMELARRVSWPSLFTSMYGRMLGRLIGLHAFSVQPDIERNRRFSERLCNRLEPPPAALKKAGRYVRELMEQQRKEIGINTQVAFPWD